jgi:hypothetical protein
VDQKIDISLVPHSDLIFQHGGQQEEVVYCDYFGRLYGAQRRIYQYGQRMISAKASVSARSMDAIIAAASEGRDERV